MDLEPLYQALPHLSQVSNRKLVETATDEIVLDFAKEVTLTDGISAITEDELIKTTKQALTGLYRPVTADRILRLVNSNTGLNKTFLRFRGWDGPIALTSQVKHIIEAVDEAVEEDSNRLSVIVDNIRVFDNSTRSTSDHAGVPDYNDAVHYLVVIEDMIDRRYLKLSKKMKVTRDSDLIITDEDEGMESSLTDRHPTLVTRSRQRDYDNYSETGKRLRVDNV